MVNLSKPFLFSVDGEKNGTLFKIKQTATGVHFVSLIVTGLMYLIEHEYTLHCLLLSLISFMLAMFTPPTGLMKPDDAPEYAKNSLTFLPPKPGFEDLKPEPQKKKRDSKKKK